MYQPDDFRVEDVPEMHALIRARPFAVLESQNREVQDRMGVVKDLSARAAGDDLCPKSSRAGLRQAINL
jgi:predicted FMN-binding regulatory protein PaiB